MTIVEIVAIVIAIACAVLVGYLVPVLIQVRKTAAESEQLLAKMNADMPPLIVDLRSMSQNLNDLADRARGGVEHAAVLLHAVGEVGESVQQVHSIVRGTPGALLANAASLVAGFKAAAQVVRERSRQDGEPHHDKGGPYNGG
ncbi:MAG: DUF948 domain-containing protein [Nitrospira sp.]|nr:DUF948 domain-containing protein [Nitrospira sp.]